MYYTTPQDSQELTIRIAAAEHADQLHRLAQRDSAAVPSGDLLIGLVDGRIRAAVSIADGAEIADPFHPTAELVALLAERAEQLRTPRGRPLRSRLANRLRGGRPRSRRSLSPQPAGTMRALD